MSGRKVFHDSVTPRLEPIGLNGRGLLVHPAGPEHLAQQMTVLFLLAMPAQRQVAVSDQVAHGETLSAKELKKRYAPLSKAIRALAQWLHAQGFSTVEVSKDRSGIYAQARAEQLERALQVKMVRVSQNGLTYTAAQNAPSLPAEIGEPVEAIVGLQPFRHAYKN